MLSLMAIAASIAAAEKVDARYSLGATVVPEHGLIAVDAIISLPSASAGSSTEFMLSRTHKVTTLETSPGASASVVSTDSPWPGLQRIVVTFREPVSAPMLRVRYSGALMPTGNPPLNMITPALVELNLDSMWVPIRTDLGARFTVEARIAGLPSRAIVVAQGDITPQGNEVHIRRDVPDLDFAFAAVPNLQRVVSTDFEFFARDPESPRSRLYLKHGPAVISFLEKWLGPMPGKPARLVVVPRERVSGYARKGYIIFTESAQGSESGLAKFTAHEFAHAWFYNANATTEHRWLDESTAEYASLRYVEHALGKAAVGEMLASKRTAALNAGPVQAVNRANAELYSKGALLLFELEERLGRARMDELFAEVARRQIGTTSDFLALLGGLAGDGAREWFALKLTEGSDPPPLKDGSSN